jgi:hypothetical protein
VNMCVAIDEEEEEKDEEGSVMSTPDDGSVLIVEAKEGSESC